VTHAAVLPALADDDVDTAGGGCEGNLTVRVLAGDGDLEAADGFREGIRAVAILMGDADVMAVLRVEPSTVPAADAVDSAVAWTEPHPPSAATANTADEMNSHLRCRQPITSLPPPPPLPRLQVRWLSRRYLAACDHRRETELQLTPIADTRPDTTHVAAIWARPQPTGAAG
jgi:hypothetical protein